MQETRTLRDRSSAADAAFDNAQGGGDPAGNGAFLLQTFKVTTYPTSASSTYACHPVDVNGEEAEGQSASYAIQDDVTQFAVGLGSVVPPEGTMVVGHHVGGRICFRYDGPA
jgi:hypothetical protein